MIKNARASHAAKELLASEGVRRLPVPVHDLAAKYAILVFREMPDDVSGILIPLEVPTQSKNWVIAVNSTHAPVRQRFTIAHELGHLVLHHFKAPHADGRLQVRFRDKKSAQGYDREEIQANQFAAELLMPERFIRGLTNNSDIADTKSDSAALEQLETWAKRFEVSVQALSLRIANLSTFAF